MMPVILPCRSSLRARHRRRPASEPGPSPLGPPWTGILFQRRHRLVHVELVRRSR